MRKFIKILATVLCSVVLAVIILPIFLMVLLNLEVVQNFVVRKAGEAITNNIGTTVSIGSIKLRGYNRLVAGDVFLQDYQGDTLIYSQSLSANISKSALLRNRIIIGDVVLDNARIYLHTPPDGELNLSQVLANIPEKEGETKKESSAILLRDVYITQAVFRYWNERGGEENDTRREKQAGSIDFSDMILNNLTLGARDLEIVGGDISMQLYDLSFTERSGFRTELLESGKFILGDGLLDFHRLRIVTPDTDLEFPRLELRGDSWDDFSDFENKVRFTATLNKSTLNFNTIGYFTSALSGVNVPMKNLAFVFNGPVNDFKGRLGAEAFGTKILLDYALKGIAADVNTSRFDLDIDAIETDAASIQKIITNFSGSALDSTVTSILTNAGRVTVTGNMNGQLSEFNAIANIATDAGDISLSGTMGLPAGSGVFFNGEYGLDAVDGRKLLDMDILGRVSMAGNITVSSGNGGINLKTNTRISELGVNGYVYHRLGFNGSVNNNQIKGLFAVSDPALRMSVSGSADIGEYPSYDLEMNLIKADLVAMKLNKTDSVSVISGRLKAQARGINLDNLDGTLTVTDLEYYTAADSIKVAAITLVGDNTESSKYLALTSPYAEAEFKSGMSYKEIAAYFQHILFDYLPSLSAGHSPLHEDIPPVTADSGEYSTFTLNIKETDEIARIFIPGLNVAKGMKLDMRFDPRSEKLHVEATSDFIEYNDYLATKLKLIADNDNPADSLRVSFSTEEIFLPKLVIPAMELTAAAKNDRIQVDANISNEETNVNARLDIGATLWRDVNGKLAVRGGFNPSALGVIGERWDITSSDITYESDRIAISEFRIHNNGQELFVDGVASESRSDTLKVRLTELSLGLFSGMTQKAGYIPEGHLTGYANLVSLLKQPFIMADIDMSGVGVNGYVAPAMKFTSVWDFANERARLILTNTLTNERILRGYYRPNDGSFVAEADIVGLPLVLADPLLSDAVADTGGTADIHINARRDAGQKLQLNGGVDLHGLTTTVAFTRTTYTIPDVSLSIAGNRITIPPVDIMDQEGGSARLEAWLDLGNLSAVSYDVKLQPRKLLAVNTTMRDNSSFYGKVYTSGNIGLQGSRLGINIFATVATDDDSAVYVPLSGASSVSSADFITYESKHAVPDTLDYLAIKKQNYLKSLEEKRSAESRSDININASLTVTPGTMLQLVIDPVRNDALEARGNATLNVSINPHTNDLSVFGTYEITEGNYLFNFQNIINNKLFVIEPGSTIQFSGDPMDALLGIKATYSLKTSLSSLISYDDVSGEGNSSIAEKYRTRVPVNCIINIGDRLSHPDIQLDVEVQTSDAELQAVANSALNTQETKAMQFIWLIAFNSFMPEDFSASPMTGTSLGLDFVTNQLNNLFATIVDGTSINIRYRPQDGINSDEVDFGFTKEFLDNRLILEYEGNYDTGYESKSGYQENPLSNNLSLTGLLNESGNVRLTAFTRTMTRYEFQGLQESGLGVYYREDFDKFSEVRQKMKDRIANWKRRRQERKEAKQEKKDAKIMQDESGRSDTGEEVKTDELHSFLYPVAFTPDRMIDVRSKSEKRPPELP